VIEFTSAGVVSSTVFVFDREFAPD